jgi:hypothetical protein
MVMDNMSASAFFMLFIYVFKHKHILMWKRNKAKTTIILNSKIPQLTVNTLKQQLTITT